jgi:uncharacterized membrane protein YraQ (UPF0718 family)
VKGKLSSMVILLHLFRWMMTALRWGAGVVLLAVAGAFIVNVWMDLRALSGGFTVAATVNCSTQPGVGQDDAATLSYEFNGRTVRQPFAKENLADYACGRTYRIPHTLYADRWIVTNRSLTNDLVRPAISPLLLIPGYALLFPKRAVALARRYSRWR